MNFFSLHFNSTSVPHANNTLNLVYGEQFMYSVTSKCKTSMYVPGILKKIKNELINCGPIFTLNIT